MAYLDYFNPDAERERPEAPSGGSAAAPATPSLANPPLGTATGAPDRPGASPLDAPTNNPAQNGTGFVSIDRYFAPNAEVSQQQTASFLGNQTKDSLSGVMSDGGVIGELQKGGDPTYSQGMAGLDAYLMGRSGLEGGLSSLKDYFGRPVTREPREPTPRKPVYDPDIDNKYLDRGGY